MGLKELFKDMAIIEEDLQISGLALDSRSVTPGNLFFALSGANQHGLMHVNQALKKGAGAVVFDPAGVENLPEILKQLPKVPFISIEGLGLKLGEIAARFYGYPSRLMNVIGITGTNGKTSCSQFLGQLVDQCGIIGTLGWGEWGKTHKTLNTTPDAISIQQILAELLADKKHTVAMEVSSHGLEQGRVNGVYFKGAVFTNISRDHLDYHGSMQAYVQSKLTLLNKPGLMFAVINLDDDYSDEVLAAVPGSVTVWGTSIRAKKTGSGESVLAENISHTEAGIQFDVCWREHVESVSIPLYGAFNVANVLTVLTVMLAMGMSMTEALPKLKCLKPVIGRMQRCGLEGDPLIFIDYAHTPDALEKVLSGLKKHCKKDLWTVFGCGGNRDTGKRPQMGACAEKWSDHVVVTDDNPRFENSTDIVNDILMGCQSNKIEVIQNREDAIKKVIAVASKDDCIVIAGKGHEDYQEINGVRFPFSDSDVVIEALKMRSGTL